MYSKIFDHLSIIITPLILYYILEVSFIVRTEIALSSVLRGEGKEAGTKLKHSKIEYSFYRKNLNILNIIVIIYVFFCNKFKL